MQAVRPGRDLPQANFLMAQLVGSYAFQAARSILQQSHDGTRRPVKLTPRQIDCITWAARGKTDWEIARILSIAETTVKEYLDDARRRYGVHKRIQLILRAIYDGHIPLSAAVR